jgi:hypothetical protein
MAASCWCAECGVKAVFVQRLLQPFGFHDIGMLGAAVDERVLLHVDTGWKFREMYEFRDRTAKAYGCELLVHKNPGLALPWTNGLMPIATPSGFLCTSSSQP